MPKFTADNQPEKRGRPKGARDKLTHELRVSLAAVLADEIEELPELLAKVEPEKRVQLVLRLCKFCLPELETVKASVADRWSADPDLRRQSILNEVERDRQIVDLGL